MAANDKFAEHARDTKQQHATEIHHYESRASIVTSHVWETPYVAKSNGTTSRGEYHPQLTTKTCSLL